jgi:hypothetical protein
MLAQYGRIYFGFLVELGAVIPILLLVLRRPRFGDPWFQALEDFATRIAARKRLAIGIVFLMTITLRVALLPLFNVPVPAIHDEYSFLLMADTFVHGRLANPPHPMWPSLDTFHVLSQPTYSSMYPPAQGFALAIGQLLGNPWFGVLLSVSAMCAAIVWMLQAWMPARFALLGGVLAMLNLALIGPWINGYYGGAVAAIGGALVLGALPRVRRRQTIGDSLLMGVGIAILANSRPLEGFIFCLPVACALLIWLFGKSSPPLRLTAVRVVAPLGLVLLLTLAFMGYYNWRVTGNALLLPESLDLRQHPVPIFLWNRLQPPVHYGNNQFDAFYNGWARTYYQGTLSDILRVSLEKVIAFPATFLWIGSLPVLLALPCITRDRKIRLLLVAFLVCVIGLFLVVWPNPHYAAPLTCVIYALLTQAIRHLRTLRRKYRPVGIAWSRVAVLLLVGVIGLHVHHAVYDLNRRYTWSRQIDGKALDPRLQVEQQLAGQPGKQLIVVRYSPNHNPHAEWVYNSADIDGSRIVWARELGTEQDQKLLSYFKDRKPWLFQPDRDSRRLTPYSLLK